VVGKQGDKWTNFCPLGNFVSFLMYPKFSPLLTRENVYINFDKKWIALHFGRFFTNSSGHLIGKFLACWQILKKTSIFISKRPLKEDGALNSGSLQKKVLLC
jgi:hypothetical protein